MKKIIIIFALIMSFPVFSKMINCQDSNKVKNFNFELRDGEKGYSFVNNSILTKIVISDSNKYSETEDFATITDLDTKRSMTYSLVCKDSK